MPIHISRFDYNKGGYIIDEQRVETALGGQAPLAVFRRGPFQVTRERKLVPTWWGQAWIERCEAEADRKTINKGRRIGRDGATLLVRLAPGDVNGAVSERLYYMSHVDLVGLTVETLSPPGWAALDTLMMHHSRYVAGLLAGELSNELYERMLDRGFNLIPRPSFYWQDHYGRRPWVSPNALALAYVIAALISDEPMLLFRMLGQDPQTLLTRWTGETFPTDEKTSSAYDITTFWLGEALPPSDDLLQTMPPPKIEALPPEYLGQIPEIREWVAQEAAHELEVMPPLMEGEPVPVFSPTNRAPDVALNAVRQSRYEDLVALTDRYCQDALDEEFMLLTQTLARSLVAQPKPLVMNGQVETWAAAIVYALAEVNQLYEENATGYWLDPNVLCAAFNRSPNTTANRAHRIRKQLGIGSLDPNWTHSAHRENDPRTHLVRVRGFLVARPPVHDNVSDTDIQRG